MGQHEHKLEIFRGLIKFKSNVQKIWGVLIFLSIVTAIEVVLGIVKPEILMNSFLNLKLINWIFLILTIMFSVSLQCQDNIHNYIIGQWEFKINVKEVIKNSNELSGLEKIAARAFSGVIEKTLDETKILFDFKENKTIAIIVTTKKEETQNRVVFNWRIDKDDKLRLDEIYDQNQVRLGDTAYWVLDEGKLIPYNKEANVNEGIVLIKLK